MKMKFIFLLTFLLSTVFQVLSTPVIIDIPNAGTGESQFEANSGAGEIVLKGKIDHRDLLTLKQHCRSIESLDMKEVTIEAYSDEDNYIDYKANELTNALAYTSTLKKIVLPASMKSIASKALAKCTALESITIPCEAMPKTDGKIFIDSKEMATVQLFVPQNLVNSYKESTIASWKFTNILPMEEQLENPFQGLELDDFYGANYFPITQGREDDPIFYVFYLDNGSRERINSIEFEYWFDNDRTTLKTKTRNDIQLEPGQEMEDGTGFITFEAPTDTRTHIITIKPVKVNGINVDLGYRVKPFRRYYVDGTYRNPTHLVEMFIDPTDPQAYEKYRTVVTCMSTLQGKTKSKDRYEIVSFIGNPNEKKFITGDTKQNDLAQAYRIDSIPRFMVDRNLMTPYGTLNNHRQLEELSAYTPALKTGEMLDVYEYLFQRGYHVPAFAQMTPEVSRNENGKFTFTLTGSISAQQQPQDNLMLNLYLVENKPLPEMGEDEIVNMEEGEVFQKIVQVISPVEGFTLQVNPDNTFAFSCDTIDIADFEAGKYRLVASIYNLEEDAPYRSSVLQACGINVTDEKPGVITMSTVHTDGKMSFALAAAQDKTPVSIDWGDGNFVNYTVGKDFSEVESELKGKNIVIKGNITKLNCISNKLNELDVTACPGLQVLQAEYNYLFNLDLSKSTELLNVEIFGNSLKSIDLTACTKLIRFVGSENFFTSLDLSKCEKLEYFDCARIKGITELDLSNAHHLKNLIVNGCSLETLTIPQDAPMTELLCAENQLSNIDVSTFDKLENIDVSNNQLQGIMVKSDYLKSLYAMNTNMKSIDLSQVPHVQYVMLTGNFDLTSVDFSNNKEITDLGISSCALSKIDATPLHKLKKLWCTNNNIESLNLVNCDSLSLLKAGGNNMKSIEFPATPDSLKIVMLPNNQFSAIKLAKMSHLVSLDLGGNQLENIDLSDLTALEVLNLRGNNIHTLDLSHNTALNMLGVIDNGMTACDLNKIYEQLPKLPNTSKAINLYNGTSSDEEAKTSKTSIAESKNWKPAVIGDGSGCNGSVDDIFSDEDMFVWEKDGVFHVLSPYAESVITIYGVDGKIVERRAITTHEATFRLQHNRIYIIQCYDPETGSMKTERIRF